MDIATLVNLRWSEAKKVLGLPDSCVLTHEVKDGYPHFESKRGYAVCFHNGNQQCHLQLSPKILSAELHRADGLVRHEIGHAVDFMTNKRSLDNWALARDVVLPATAERRADAIALAIWRTPIRYDSELVQSTKVGQNVRPAHLGL